MTVSIQQQNLQIDEVETISVTPIAQDLDAGDYVRDIRVLDADGVLVAQLRLRSTVRDKLEITTPPNTF